MEVLFILVAIALGILGLNAILAILGLNTILGAAMHVVLLPVKILLGIVLFALALPFLLLLLPFAILAGVAVLVGGILFGALCLLALAP